MRTGPGMTRDEDETGMARDEDETGMTRNEDETGMTRDEGMRRELFGMRVERG